jgi:multimeric flavodoxin WrbA
MANVLVAYHSYTHGPVERLAHRIGQGAGSVAGTTVLVESVETVSDEEILEADGIAIGSPKGRGHTITTPVQEFIERLYRLRSKLALKVGTAFSGSHGSYGGQQLVHQVLFSAMLACHMSVVGYPYCEDSPCDFIGGVIIGDLDKQTGRWAEILGQRLAEVARRMARA